MLTRCFRRLKKACLSIYTFLKMSDTQKMLQAIINGQTALKRELLIKIDNVDQKVDRLGDKVDGLDGKIDRVEQRLTERLDKIGRQLAYLEDTPTREEYDSLEKRVGKMSKVLASQ